MRFSTATSLISVAVAPVLAQGFVPGKPIAIRTDTSLAARRSRFPILRRTDLLFPDMDRMFEEMDEMMESSLAIRFPRPALSLSGKGVPEELKLRRPLGFEVTQDDTEYKVAVHVPDVEAKDIDLQLDHDGRVLRLRGNRVHEDGGMKVQSRFEKAILLSPDVDTAKLAANMSGMIEKKLALDDAKDKKIEIKIEEPNIALQDDVEKPPTKLAVESLKDETAETPLEEESSSLKMQKPTLEGEARWPVRDFPY